MSMTGRIRLFAAASRRCGRNVIVHAPAGRNSCGISFVPRLRLHNLQNNQSASLRIYHNLQLHLVLCLQTLTQTTTLLRLLHKSHLHSDSALTVPSIYPLSNFLPSHQTPSCRGSSSSNKTSPCQQNLLPLYAPSQLNLDFQPLMNYTRKTLQLATVALSQQMELTAFTP